MSLGPLNASTGITYSVTVESPEERDMDAIISCCSNIGLGTQHLTHRSTVWAQRVRDLIRSGVDRERAGDLAAREVFSDYRSRIYASEADTIETLLRLVEDKK